MPHILRQDSEMSSEEWILKGTEFEKYEEFEFLKLSHGDTPLQNLKKIRE